MEECRSYLSQLDLDVRLHMGVIQARNDDEMTQITVKYNVFRSPRKAGLAY